MVGAVLLAAFAFFWGIREFASFDTYQRTLLFLGVWVSKVAFSDFHAILSAAQCYRLGFDVFVVNPCDFAGRVHIYSPLWLKLIPSGLDTTDTWWTGAALAILFLLSLAWLCPARSRQEFWLFLILCCSSAVLFATVRANNDTIVFMLMLTAGKVFPSQKFRPIGYGAVLLAAALKFYPFAAFAVLVADRPRRALAIGGLAVGAAVIFVLLWHREIAVAAEHFPAGYLSDKFSARNLVGTLPVLFPQRFGFVEPHVAAATSVLILLAVLAAAGLAIGLGRKGIRLFLGLEETVLFLGGGAMIVACFFVGHNIHYRAILLLLTVPLLLAWTRDDLPAVRLTGWIGIGLVAFAVFENFLRTSIFSAVGAVNGPVHRTRIAFWAFEELMWWALAISLTSALFLIAWDSPTGMEARRIARSGVAVFAKLRSVRSLNESDRIERLDARKPKM
jgi:hypothetical protein